MNNIQQEIVSTIHPHEAQTIEFITDYEVRSLDTSCINETELQHPWWYNFKYLITGILFGIVLVKSEVISWFRIQEMFRLQSFHMYGVIGTAIVTGMLSVWLIKKFKIKIIYKETIYLPLVKLFWQQYDRFSINRSEVNFFYQPYGKNAGGNGRTQYPVHVKALQPEHFLYPEPGYYF